MSRGVLLSLVLTALGTLLPTAAAQRPPVEIVGHVFKPEVIPPPATAALTVPAGFTVSVFATGLGHPRILVPGPNGSLYVTRRDPGDIVRIADQNDDGAADTERVVVRRPQLHGLAIHGSKAYFVGVNDLFVADIGPDGAFSNTTRIIDDLPEGGQHADRTVVWGPDDALYLSVGSTCNVCDETSPEDATMLRISPDGKSRTVFAAGLRNTIGFAFRPGTRDLFGFDHGIDWHGSWNRKQPSGYEVARVRFENGHPTKIEPFLRGFLTADSKQAIGRPFGVAVAADGSLFVGDDENGVIYRVSYDGRRTQ